MTDIEEKLQQYGLRIPEILLPADRTIMNKWAVIACDQYTSQVDYWKQVEKISEGSPSTLNMIYPECYLEEKDPEQRIKQINQTMNDYISKGVFSEPLKGFILIKRDTSNIKNRWGLIGALDLEHYDYNKDSKSLIRATEGTILERIPPRVKIRENAPLELPHIMVLIDDPEKTIIEPLAASSEELKKVYDFELMMGSGHLTGYLVDSEKHIGVIADALSNLGSEKTLKKRYNSDKPFIFAMGDGNHSLATAKTIWETYKKNHSKEPGVMEHPSRWALVEIVNIFSEGIVFEAIHRVLFDCNPDNFLDKLKNNKDFKVFAVNGKDEMLKKIDNAGLKQICGYSTGQSYGIIEAINPDSSIIAGTIQNFIDKYLEDYNDAEIDYIHGIDITEELGAKAGNLGIYLPSIKKDTFFQTVINDGAFPRKTFSMGEAFEKRFYVEARKIV